MNQPSSTEDTPARALPPSSEPPSSPNPSEGPLSEEPAIEADCDLIKTAFVRAFTSASDPTSFLRVAQIPFEAWTADGERLVLLRVEMDSITDVGSMMPHLGGTSFRYDPLPGKLVTHRERLRFVYFDGKEQRHLPLGSVRALRLPPAER